MHTEQSKTEISELARALAKKGIVVETIDAQWKLSANGPSDRASFAEIIVLRMDPNDRVSFYWAKNSTKISDANDIQTAVKTICHQLRVTTA